MIAAQKEQVLSDLAQGFTTPNVGMEFLNSLVSTLQKILKVDHVFIGALTRQGSHMKSLSFLSKGEFIPQYEYALSGSPCEQVVGKKFRYFPAQLQELFPEDQELVKFDIHSYAGIPLFNSKREPLGILSALHSEPLNTPEQIENLFMIVARRVELELERMMYEETLKSNEVELKEAQHIAKIGNFEWTAETDRLTWSDELYRIYGYKAQEKPVNFEFYIKHIHPDYRKKVKSEIYGLLQKPGSFDHVYAITNNTGEMRYLRSVGKTVLNGEGQLEKIIGVCHDITKIKLQEQELKKFAEELEERVNHRTKTLEESLAREKLMREIAEITLHRLENVEEMFQQVAEKLGVFMQADRVLLFSYQDYDPSRISVSGLSIREGVPGIEESGVPVLPGQAERITQSNSSLEVCAACPEDLPQSFRSYALENQIQSLLVFEILYGHKLYGRLCIHSLKKRPWTDQEIRVVDDVIRHLTSAIDKIELHKRERKAHQHATEAEHKLRIITDNIPAYVSYINANGEYEYINKRYTDFFQVRSSQLIGQKPKVVIQTQTSVSDKILEALNGNEVTYENVVISPGGEKQTLLVRYIPEFDSNNQVNGIVVLGSDITDLKAIERRLAENEERLRITIAATQMGTWDIDPGTGVVKWDKRCKTLLGLAENAKDELAVFLDGVIPSDREMARTALEKALDPDKREKFELEFRTVGSVDKKMRWLRAVGETFFNSRAPKRFVGGLLDITERKRLEQQKNDFLGIASHELKTPVTSIKGYIQLLEQEVRNKGNEQEANQLKKVDNQINKLVKLINDLLDVTKIESGKLEFNPEPFDFDRLTADTVKAMQYLSPKHQLILHGSTGKRIIGDKDRIEQVITNFISNAVKYSPAAHQVDIHISAETDYVHLSVTDYGLGISTQHLQKIFDRFFRVNSTGLWSSGLGLGLYISAEIIERHKGTISVDSVENKGSVFKFSLPLKVK